MTKTKVMLTVSVLALVLLVSMGAATNALAQTGSPAPGLYVTDLKIDPNPPTVGNTFTFTPSFQNTSNNSLTFNWRVLIYRAVAPDKSYSDTTWMTSSFPTGASTLLSPGEWNVPAGTPCDWYFARVVWQDDNNNEVPFMAPGGKVFEKGFTTCP